jgi:hypothetical protein
MLQWRKEEERNEKGRRVRWERGKVDVDGPK